MELSTLNTGPGGTEVLVRPEPLRGKSGLQSAPSQRTACRLRLAVQMALRRGVSTEIDSSLQQRQQFWIDTCRAVTQMRAASEQVLDLHRQFGCLFHAPAPQQVQSILDALDAACPDWDRDHPGLFYRTLELNFPELVRVCRV